MNTIKDFLPKYILEKAENRLGDIYYLSKLKENGFIYDMTIVSNYKHDTKDKFYQTSSDYYLIDMIEDNFGFITISESNYNYLKNLAIDDDLERFLEKAEFVIFCDMVTKPNCDMNYIVKKLKGDD